jgi:peptide/nickel transport system permease protein
MTLISQAINAPKEIVGDRQRALRVIVTSVEGAFGLALGALILAIIVFGPFAAPYSPTELGVGPPNQAPSALHLLGTDNYGRDIFSRFLWGGRTVILIPWAAVTLALSVGAPLGMLGAYARGWIDNLIARAFDIVLSLPPLLIVIVLVSGLDRSRIALVASVALVFAPRIGRVVRGATQGVVTNDYISAAQARGERTAWILGREVLPNIAAPTIVDYALRLTWAILFVSTLNFLGLGEQAPSSDWGLMIAQSRASIGVAPLATLAPAAGIVGLAVSVNLVADALTKFLNPEANRAGVRV